MTKPSDKSSSSELILYQLGQVQNLMENMSIKFDNYKENNDKRIQILEIAVANQKAISDSQPSQKIDIQKIILAALALVSTVVASALGLNRNSQ